MGEPNPAVQRSLGEVEHGRCLDVREADVAQICLARPLDGNSVDVTVAKIDDALMNGRRGLRREELARDRASQRGESLRHWRTSSSGRGTDVVDELFEGSISLTDDGGDLLWGEGSGHETTIAELSWAG